MAYQTNVSKAGSFFNQYVALRRNFSNKIKKEKNLRNSSSSSKSNTQGETQTDIVCEGLLESLRQLPDENRPNDWLVPSLIH
jgi:hypothetical protein